MGILADHEGLYEVSRIGPAALLALGLVLLSVAIAVGVARRAVRPWYRARPARLALAGSVAMVIAAVAGIVTRDTSGSYVICGPVLHVTRDDSASCAGVLDPLPWIVAGSIALSVALTLGAVVAQRVD